MSAEAEQVYKKEEPEQLAESGAYGEAGPEDAGIDRDEDIGGAEHADPWADGPEDPVPEALPPVRADPPGGGRPQTALIAGIIIAVGVAAFFAGTYVTGMGSQVSEDYIDNAIARLELKLLENRLPTDATAPPAPPPQVRPAAADEPTLGSPDAPIEIIEYSDFQCPFCARFYAQTLPLLEAEYISQGKAKLVFRDFPLQNLHPNAAAAALAGECAHAQGMFKGMHDVLFERQGEWNRLPTTEALSVFAQYADELGVEAGAFGECLSVENRAVLDRIGSDLSEGNSYGVTGTPGFFVGNEQLGYVEIKGAQPYEVFKQILDTQLSS